MPAVTEKAKRRIRVKKRSTALENYIRELMRSTGRKQSECAAVLGITQPGFSYSLKNMSFDIKDMIALLDYLGADQEEVAGILAKGR